MRRHGPTHPVLAALLLVVFMAAQSLFAVSEVGLTAVETAVAAGPQAAKLQIAAVTPQAPGTGHDNAAVHDGATVHRGSASPAHSVRLLVAADPGGDHSHLSRPGATRAATTAGDDLGRRAAIRIQSRAPPAAAR